MAAWIPRLAPLHICKHGVRVRLSVNCAVAERFKPAESAYDGVVYTAEPLQVGEMWRITVLNTTSKWSRGLRVGLTSGKPKHVPHYLVSGDAGPREWVCDGDAFYHNEHRSNFPELPHLSTLLPGQSLGLLVTPSSQLHIFLDGEYRCQAATGLPVDQPLWGMADVQGKCTKIMSEKIRGEKGTAECSSDSKKPSATDDARPETQENNIAMSDLVVSREHLGGGAQGMVFRGTWKGMEVAVKKCLQPDPRDVSVLLSLGGHPNVIRLYGVVTEEYSCLVVTELVKGGSLFDFLYKEKKTPLEEQRSYWMKDIAMGMEFLHHQGIAHRDLKSGNVLLGDRMMAKICDFGTARSLDHTTCQSAVSGTYRWMAPEIVDSPDARINKKCDLYSYAMVLYELVTLKKPFHDAPTDQKAMMVAAMGMRPILPRSDSECPPFLRCLITACWDADPKLRPSFEMINFALDSKTFPIHDAIPPTSPQ